MWTFTLISGVFNIKMHNLERMKAYFYIVWLVELAKN